MSKSLRIAFRWLLVIIVALAFPFLGNAQPMPERLNMEWLLNQPKYRNIHHDSFCRADSKSEIGHNALPSRPNVLGYKTLTLGTINVGIHNNYATNFVKRRRKGRAIEYVNAGRPDYHITAVKAKERNCDVKVAFYVSVQKCDIVI